MIVAAENQNLEFKESWRDEYLKWICGFANANGGKIYLGVADNGEIKGLENTKKLLEELPNKIRDLLGIMVDVNLKEADDKKEYIEIVVEPYPSPISYKGQYYYRSGSTKQELKGTALDKFLLKKQGKRWDSIPVPYFSLKELDPRAIEYFKEKASKKKRIDEELLKESDEVLLEKLHLKEGNYLKKAATLLFTKDTQKYVMGSTIKIGYFKSNTDLIYQDEITGNIFEQVDKCVDLVFTKYLSALISYEGVQRVESFPISQSAFREAITNAVVHKDYSEETSIQISIYDDKLMMHNCGELPENWTIETLRQKHSSKPYNPTIAYPFFLAGYIESWGRGIEKIVSESKSFNGVTPTFRWVGGLWAEFAFNDSAKEFGELQKSSPKSSPKTEEKILELIANNPKITTQEMAEALNLTKRAILKQISRLKELKQIERVGSGRSGYWKTIEEGK